MVTFTAEEEEEELDVVVVVVEVEEMVVVVVVVVVAMVVFLVSCFGFDLLFLSLMFLCGVSYEEQLHVLSLERCRCCILLSLASLVLSSSDKQ